MVSGEPAETMWNTQNQWNPYETNGESNVKGWEKLRKFKEAQRHTLANPYKIRVVLFLHSGPGPGAYFYYFFTFIHFPREKWIKV